MLRTLDHVVVAVRDLEAATETYRRLLGRDPSWRGRHPGAGTANALFRLENVYLELLARDGDAPLAESLAPLFDREGLAALAFGTGDAEACAAAFRERGLPIAGSVDGRGADSRTGAERRWRNVFLSPEGTRGVILFAIEQRSPPEALPPAEPNAAAESAISGIDHVVVQSGDPEAAIDLYRERLGLRLALDRTFEQWGARLLFFRIGGVTVEVAHALDGDPGAADHLWGISWRSPDVTAARERLAAAGFDVSEVRTGRKPGTRVFTVREGTHGVATLVIGPESSAVSRFGRAGSR
ncbi:MAG: VOC family protein [Candidatus Binatia bacterium]